MSPIAAPLPPSSRSPSPNTCPTDRASLVIAGDASTFVDALRARHPNVEVIPLTELNLDAAALK